MSILLDDIINLAIEGMKGLWNLYRVSGFVLLNLKD
jgi:hypothetical protein